MNLYIKALTAITWLVWPLTTWATAVTLGATIGSVPISAWSTVIVLSAVSGMIALLQRMNKAIQLESQIDELHVDSVNKDLIDKLRVELSQVQVPVAWRLFVTWHMAGALAMGCLAFLALEAYKVNDYIEAVVIAISSYGGASFYDKVSNGFMVRLLNQLTKNDTNAK